MKENEDQNLKKKLNKILKDKIEKKSSKGSQNINQKIEY
jgi:hypothetical protein